MRICNEKHEHLPWNAEDGVQVREEISSEIGNEIWALIMRLTESLK